jgi:hypothetical protein
MGKYRPTFASSRAGDKGGDLPEEHEINVRSKRCRPWLHLSVIGQTMLIKLSLNAAGALADLRQPYDGAISSIGG